MNATNRKSGFFLVGGKSDTCDASLLELAGGEDARIVVIPHASGIPDEVAADLVRDFARLGATQVSVIKPPSRFAARLAAWLYRLGAKRLSRLVSDTSILPGTTAVYLTGGDQSRLVEKLGPGGVAALRAYSRSGGLIYGTSAGAACMGTEMITGGMKDGAIRAGSLSTGKGLGLVPRVAFDTHMVRNRYNRPIVALATLDIDLAIGLDEDTGVWINNNVATVLGVGKVWFYRRQSDFAVDFDSGTAAGVNVLVRTAGGSVPLTATCD